MKLKELPNIQLKINNTSNTIKNYTYESLAKEIGISLTKSRVEQIKISDYNVHKEAIMLNSEKKYILVANKRISIDRVNKIAENNKSEFNYDSIILTIFDTEEEIEEYYKELTKLISNNKLNNQCTYVDINHSCFC